MRKATYHCLLVCDATIMSHDNPSLQLKQQTNKQKKTKKKTKKTPVQHILGLGFTVEDSEQVITP